MRWLAQLEADRATVRRDLPDLTRWFLATGVRMHRTLPLPLFAMCMLERRMVGSTGPGPLFPDAFGRWRDPSNLSRELREARGSGEFAWVTSHVFRMTCATLLDERDLSTRQIADQLGHAKVSMTQDNYLGRRLMSRRTARALDAAIGRALE